MRSVLVLGLLAGVAAGQGGWQVQTSGVEDDLLGVAFATDQVGVAVGKNHTIVRTTDGGQTWTRVRSPEKRGGDLGGVLFTDEKTGWARNLVAGGVYRTTDGGATWQSVKTFNQGSVYGPTGATNHAAAGNTYFWQNSGGAFGGNKLYRTTDAGKTWTPLWESDGKLGGGGVSLSFPDGQHGWMASIGKAIPREFYVARSTDGGKTWTAQQIKDRVAGNYMKIHAVDKDRAWFASHFSTVVHASTDGGKTWTAHELGNGQDTTIVGLRFLDENVGHVLCDGTTWQVRRTADGGKTWSSLGQPAKVPDASGMFFRSADLGWVVGPKGYIARYQAR
jgi:photosystem II stability/assembly factor-like uncharacterized protein